MTRNARSMPGKPPPRRPVPRLHRAGAMRPALAALALALLAARPALAQNSACTTSGANAAGTSPTVTFSLAVKTGTNAFTSLSPNIIQNVLDLAECTCNSQDLFVQGTISKSIQSDTAPAMSEWVGTSCNVPASRTLTCEDLSGSADAAKPQDFTLGSMTGIPRFRVDVPALVSPRTTSNTMPTCPAGTITNSVWLLFGDQNNPDYCTLQLNYFGTPPALPTAVTATSGDEAVQLAWKVPVPGTANPPSNYQVLCARVNSDGGFEAVPGHGGQAFGDSPQKHQLRYSTCTKNGIQRQFLNLGGVTPGGDAGVSADLGAVVADPGDSLGGGGTLSGQDDPLGPQDDPLDAGTAAPGVCPEFSSDADGGVAASTTIFNDLDKKYVCSDQLGSTATGVRITGLVNQQAYVFAVVAIDKQGNPSVTAPQCTVPLPVEDLYRRFLADGGKPQGFCFIATAAWGSYQSPFVMVLRDFRDQVLLATDAGSRFVAWYYRTSPPIADFIRSRPAARFAVRVALWPLIVLAVLWMWTGPAEGALLAGLLVALACVRLRRRARQRSTRPAALPLPAAGSAA